MTAAAFSSAAEYAAAEYAAAEYAAAKYAGAEYAAADLEPDLTERFDDSDGAYAVAEPDPFDSLLTPAHRPSLRAELGSAPAGPVAGLLRPALAPLPVAPGLAELFPDGLRRGSTIAVTSSVSLLLALLGGPSGRGAWTALVGMPTISAEAAAEAGIDLARLAIISAPDGCWTGANWTTAVGALLDAVDVVVARPGAAGTVRNAITDGDARRLTARTRSKDAVLVLFGQAGPPWPGLSLTLTARHGGWTGIGAGYGRLVQRKLLVTSTGKGRSARPRDTELWL
ncbi:MAG: hypothetical protein ABI140_11570 [Jatrophihabitantaceae bacterium]